MNTFYHVCDSNTIIPHNGLIINQVEYILFVAAIQVLKNNYSN